MHVTKNAQGESAFSDEPMRLDGEAAEQFLADMHQRDEAGNSSQQQLFLEECLNYYLSTKTQPTV